MCENRKKNAQKLMDRSVPNHQNHIFSLNYSELSPYVAKRVHIVNIKALSEATKQSSLCIGWIASLRSTLLS